MHRKPWCREERFLAAEKTLLAALPQTGFEVKYYSEPTVANNHIYLGKDKHYYSVPFAYVGIKVKVIYTRSMVYIYARGKQVAVHIRSYVMAGYNTDKEHLSSHHRHLQKLLLKTKMSRIDGTIYKFFKKLSKAELLIFDDFGLTHLEQQQRMDFMEIIEDTHASAATIIASQLPVANWYDVIGEETIADAILDRMVHTSYGIELKAESLRKKR
ncbi:ATP-binding protein [Pedobacter sp. MC2016-14]|uniref:ATP-binding protein n=1 Tax=Pedobacter sp. MC2016-14 TaxID=2897327 RepID=UPI001E282B0D|nr:ATP-binding protein [Pedobacter sp. MC2016-14]MCD0488891.1 ATP-binding protein [Pedobacter sp. MC2016-14]